MSIPCLGSLQRIPVTRDMNNNEIKNPYLSDLILKVWGPLAGLNSISPTIGIVKGDEDTDSDELPNESEDTIQFDTNLGRRILQKFPIVSFTLAKISESIKYREQEETNVDNSYPFKHEVVVNSESLSFMQNIDYCSNGVEELCEI
jgi:hypothetical protein